MWFYHLPFDGSVCVCDTRANDVRLDCSTTSWESIGVCCGTAAVCVCLLHTHTHRTMSTLLLSVSSCSKQRHINSCSFGAGGRGVGIVVTLCSHLD